VKDSETVHTGAEAASVTEKLYMIILSMVQLAASFPFDREM
jgi:hypothetical protein